MEGAAMNREIVSNPDYRIQGILTDIEKAALEQVKDEEFVEQDVYLDGREFQGCTFRNCRIFAKLGHFVIRGSLLKHCSFEFGGPAKGVKSVFDMLADQN
jgi:hypothetical protein